MSEKLSNQISIDDRLVEFTEGETLYQIAQRCPTNDPCSHPIPTLCYDDRLDPVGSCRLCVVEVDGFRNPVASCTTKASPGMVVQTQTDQIEKYRQTLLEMVASENREIEVDPLRGYASQELSSLIEQYEVRTDRFSGHQSGNSHQTDDNPFILRDYDLCISCYRCVRVCAEQEGDYAINIMNRGFESQITTEFNTILKDSACTFCGQCVQTCPTGALADKKALRAVNDDSELEKTRSVCSYCGVGCSVDLVTKSDRVVAIQPAMDGPANQGALCVKGQFAFDFVHHPDRLKVPLVRNKNGLLEESSWEFALDRAAAGFQKAKDSHGRHSVYGVASGRAPIEAAYMMQKFIRAGFGTNYIDNCSRA